MLKNFAVPMTAEKAISSVEGLKRARLGKGRNGLHVGGLGLGEGRYPAVDVPNPLDLRQIRRSAGDVSSAERDRYLFLETLLATRDQPERLVGEKTGNCL